MEPLTIRLAVACRPEHAFAVWTDRIDTWWPADHTVSGDTAATIVLEPYVGGRIFERAPDGTEHEWGEVTAWEPPRRLDYRWHLRTARSARPMSRSRSPTTAGGTSISIVHSGWERLGDDATGWRDRNLGGWTTLLPHFTGAVAHLENRSL